MITSFLPKRCRMRTASPRTRGGTGTGAACIVAWEDNPPEAERQMNEWFRKFAAFEASC